MFESLEFEAAGRVLRGFLAVPERIVGGPRGGALICHGGSGVQSHEREQLERLARLGFVAFAPDLFGEALTDRAHGMRLIGALLADPESLRSRVVAALDVLRARVTGERLVAIGHCFGGFAALELGRTGVDVRAVVCFHGRLATAASVGTGTMKARVLVCSGADDPFSTLDERASFEAEMTAAGADWQHHVYGGVVHGFSVEGIVGPGCAYHSSAARRSWAAATALFEEVLGSPSPSIPGG